MHLDRLCWKFYGTDEPESGRFVVVTDEVLLVGEDKLVEHL